MDMKQRTERFEMRLTPEEIAGIREKSKRYHSVSNFIRMAVNEFSDTDAKTRLELCNDTARLCRKFQDELSWMGSNLNQAVKRANELAVAGILSESYFRDNLSPLIEKVSRLVVSTSSSRRSSRPQNISVRPTSIWHG